jgi:hypothetical protein
MGKLGITRYWGERVEVTHGGETLVIYVEKYSSSQGRLLFEGPLSFSIVRPAVVQKTAPTFVAKFITRKAPKEAKA